jgi:hypothetical protein
MTLHNFHNFQILFDVFVYFGNLYFVKAFVMETDARNAKSPQLVGMLIPIPVFYVFWPFMFCSYCYGYA